MVGRRPLDTAFSLSSVYAICILFVLAQQTRLSVIYVLPNDHFNQCQVSKCYHLTDDNIFSGNVSNTMVIFYPGTHTINSTVNKVISINNATTLELTAANLSEGATINCNGNVGFAFSYCTNVTISCIKFEGCGAHRDNEEHPHTCCTSSKFTLLISHSYDVHLSAVTVRNGGGIGLLVVNVCGLFVLSDSGFTNNTCNFHFFSKDSVNTISGSTNVVVKNSYFVRATACKHMNDRLIGNVRPSGVAFKLLQTQFNLRAAMANVTFVENQIFTITIEINLHTNKLTMENLKSVSANNRYGMGIYPAALSTNQCISEATCIAITMNNAHFRSPLCIIVTSRGKPNQDSTYHVVLSNIFVKNTGSRYSLLIIKVPSIMVTNATIQNTTGNALFIDCNLLLLGQYTYQQNHGSIVLLRQNRVVIDNATIIIRQNKAFYYAPLFTDGSYLEIENSFITIENNTGLESGGIVLFNSKVMFKGSSQIAFWHNSGTRGGAMTFYQKSKLMFDSVIIIFTFVGNHASVRGGAIYVHDDDYVHYQLSKITHTNFLHSEPGKSNFYMYFSNNTAAQAGSAVYGGKIDKRFHFNSSLLDDESVVSSDPFKVCMCTSSKLDCSTRKILVELLPGQVYEIEVVAVGQGNGIAPTTIRAKFEGQSQGQLGEIEYIQSAGVHCTKLTYTIKFSNETEQLQLTTTDQTVWKEKEHFKIIFQRQNCTVGFAFDVGKDKCVCNHVLTDHGIECDIQTLRVNRLSQKWISVTRIHLSQPSQQSGVIVHDYCPFDYCIATAQSLNLFYPDQQCAFSRSGILCGACQTNFSHVLGTSKCKQCTKPWIALIIPLIAIAGVALVVGLMLLNLTVSLGTINGLIFYANIVRANQAVFFPHDVSNSFLSMFIAWLNLDLGIETCFYNGLDAYSKTWFQFLFPLYIWLMVTAIIVASHYSTRASKMSGHNAVQVLATLFLLSYAKLLRIIITVFSSTELVYPDGYHRRVWLYDGNVDYFKGKHIPLFIAALLLLVFVSFPFTAILFCTQWLQKLSNKKVLFWVGKLQPLFDAYTGPYKIKHRYWTGLLLLIRVCLFLVFSLNTIGNPAINLLAISVSMSCLFAYLSLTGGVYKRWWLNLIETSFILNLLISSAAGFYQINTSASIKPITYTSTGTALLLFIAILLYHTALQVINTKMGQKLTQTIETCLDLLRKGNLRGQCRPEMSHMRSEPEDGVTYSVVQLEEPLL